MDVKKISVLVFLLANTYSLYGCYANETNLSDIYTIAFEELLAGEALNDNIAYISLFVNDEKSSEKDLDVVQNHFEQEYGKKIYTYTLDEVNHAGSYGKEDLALDGLFLKLTEIVVENDKVTIKGEKFHTDTRLGALGMDIAIFNKEGAWKLDQSLITWE